MFKAVSSLVVSVSHEISREAAVRVFKLGCDSGVGGIRSGMDGGIMDGWTRLSCEGLPVMNGQMCSWWGRGWVRAEPLLKECILLQCAGKMKTEGRGLHHFTGDWCFLGGEVDLGGAGCCEPADSLVGGWWELCAVAGGGNGLVAVGRRSLFCNCRMCGWSTQIAYLQQIS